MKHEIYLVPPEKYPLALGNSIYKPKQLYAIGELPPPASTEDDRTGTPDIARTDIPVGIAMVGTRRPGANAKLLCKRLVDSLQGTRAVVVSGLAQGIDSFSHEAALDAGIPTVAVLAQGLGTRIEGTRGELAKRILEAGGALVSEFEPDEPAYKSNFPARNRIISGMSVATLIVQSKAKGGALLTGEFTRKEGKPLYAIPGDFDNEVASGPNALLNGGLAKPVFIPESLRTVLGFPKTEGLSLQGLSLAGLHLGNDALELFKRVNGFRKTICELQSEFDFNISQLLTILTELEIAGLAHTDDNFVFQFDGVN
jgi:DNA processing protein